MGVRSKNRSWKQKLAVPLIFSLAFGGLTNAFVPSKAVADDAEESFGTPGGVAGTILWLQPEGTSGQSVSEWKDRSVSQNHATQATPAYQPTFWDDAAHNVNFNPVVHFNGSNSSLLLDIAKLPQGNSPRTIVAVAQTKVDTGNHYIISWGTSTTSKMIGMMQINTTGALTGHSNAFQSSGNFWEVGVPNELFGTWDGTDASLYSRMKTLGSGNRNYWNTGNTQARIGSIIGGGEYWQGAIGDIIVYDRVLTETERQQVSSFLAIKYGYMIDQGTPINYLNSAGAAIWQAAENSQYGHNIAGIGHDVDGSLNQKQSHSTNTGDQVLIGLGSIEETNSANQAVFAQDKQYLLWGDNGKLLTFDQQIGGTDLFHAQRIWKAQNSNGVGQVQVAIAKTAIPSGAKLLFSNSDTDFSAATEVPLSDLQVGSTTYSAASLTLSDGQYFTYAVTPPKVTSAVISRSGKQIVLTFDQEVSLTDQAGFRVETNDGQTLVIDSIQANGQSVTLTLSQPVAGVDTVQTTVTYEQANGNLKHAQTNLFVGDFSQLATVKQASAGTPGGVGGASLWLKADGDVESTNGKLTAWNDQTGTNDFTVYGAPSVLSSGVNFNPAVKFENGGSSTALSQNRMDGNQQISYVDGYAVVNFRKNAGGALVGSKQSFTNYGAAVFAQESSALHVGNGTNSTYYQIPYTYYGQYRLAGYDIHAGDSNAIGRLNGKDQTLSRPATFTSLNFIPMIGGSNGAGNSSNWQQFNGEFSEVILYPASTAADRNRIESYLALKYGLTLNDGQSDYTASNGSTKMWKADDNAGYGKRITGIGKDSGSDLEQKQSKSQESGATVALSLGTAIAASNKENANSIAQDDSFFTFSDNGATVAYDNRLLGKHLKAMKRVFKVDKTDSWQDGSITLQADGANGTAKTYLLISEGESFASPSSQLLLDSSGKVTLDSSKLADGAYFTFAQVDKGDLQAKVDEIVGENLVEGDYKAAGWAAFQQALTDANGVLNNQGATPSEVAAALQALTDARDGLVLATAPDLNITKPASDKIYVTKPTIKGTTDPDATVTVTIKDEHGTVVASGTATVDAAGNWSYTTPSNLPDGAYTLDVVAAKDGKQTTKSKQVTVDAVAGERLSQLDLNGLSPDGSKKIDLSPTFDPGHYGPYAGRVPNDTTEFSINPKAFAPEDTDVKVSLNGVQVAPGQWDNLPLKEGINIVKVGVYDKSGNLLNEYTTTIIRSTDKLESLVPSAGNLSPAFDADKPSYTVQVANGVEKLHLTPKALDPNAKIEISVNGGPWQTVDSGEASDDFALQVGNNQVVVRVTDPENKVKEYKLTVTRAGTGDGGTPGETKEWIPVDVVIGGDRPTGITKLQIERTKHASGKITDKVVFTPDKAAETAEKAALTGDHVARIVIPDAEDKVSEVDVNVLRETLHILQKHNIDLEIYTANGIIQIPNSSLAGLDEDFYFRLVPVKDPGLRKEVEDRAKTEPVVRKVAGKNRFEVVTRPMTIETNLSSRPVVLTLPLRDVDLPKDEQARQQYLQELGIFIEHTDGEKEVVFGDVVTLAGGELGLRFSLTKFSTFTILHFEGIKVHQNYISGYPDGTFRPDRSVTRAEIATMLANAGMVSGEATGDAVELLDVENHWAASFIKRVSATGWMSGYPDHTFKPDGPITRREMAAVAFKYLGLSGTATGNSFTDVTADDWAHDIIAAVREAGVIAGYPDGTFRPAQQLSRAEAVTILNQLFKRGPLHGVTQSSWPDVDSSHWAFHNIEEASQKHRFTDRSAGGEDWLSN